MGPGVTASTGPWPVLYLGNKVSSTSGFLRVPEGKACSTWQEGHCQGVPMKGPRAGGAF